MNKKILLGTLLTSSVLTAALVAPKAMAATIDGNGSKLTGSINSGKISVVLPSANDKVGLTKDALVKLINEKCGKDIVESIKKADGTEITEGNVGTGAVVELTSGDKLTVVLYGDANGNGKVNMFDAVAIAQHTVGNEMLKGDYLLASELTDAIDEKLELNDSTRVACYDVKLVGTEARYGITLVDEALYPVDEFVIPDEVITGAINDLGENEEFKFDFNTETNEVTCEFLSDEDKNVSDFVGLGTGFISKLVDQLKNSNVENVKITFGDKEVELKNGATSKDVLDAAKEILGNTLDFPVDDLVGTKLEVAINFNNPLLVSDGGLDSNTVNYVLKFKKHNIVDSDEFLNDVIDELASSTEDIFSTEFDLENKKVNFTILQDATFSSFVDVINSLVNPLRNTEGLEKIVVDNIPSSMFSSYTIDKDIKDTTIEGLKGILEQTTAKLKEKLCGKVLKVKVYITNEFKFVNKEDIETDDKGQYIEYNFNFIDGTNDQ